MNILKKKRKYNRKKVRIYESIFTKKQIQFIRDNYYNKGAIYCAKQLKVFTPKQIRGKATHLRIKVNKDLWGKSLRNKENLSHILSIKTPFIAYFLGFLWADGTISPKTSNVELCIVNDDFKDIKKEVFKLTKSYKFGMEHDGNPNHKEQAAWEINHWEFRDFLVKYDYLIKSGTSAKKILSIIPEKFKHYWWRGYFDGDGGFSDGYGKTRRITLTSTLDQNWDFVDELCKFLDIGYRISRWDDMNGPDGGKHTGSCINFENET